MCLGNNLFFSFICNNNIILFVSKCNVKEFIYLFFFFFFIFFFFFSLFIFLFFINLL